MKRGLGDTTDPRGDSKSAGCGFTKLHQLPKRMFCWVAPTKISSELMMSDFPERITLVIRKSSNVVAHNRLHLSLIVEGEAQTEQSRKMAPKLGIFLSETTTASLFLWVTY